MSKRKSIRQGRVNDVLQREIAKFVQLKFSMATFGMITICEVDVASDFAHAKVFFSVFPQDKLKAATIALEDSAGLIRKQLSQAISLRTVPKINFVYDTTLKTGNYMDGLIESTRPQDLSAED